MSISMEDSRVVEEDDEFLYEEDESCVNSGLQHSTTPAPPLPTPGPPLPSRTLRPSGLGVSEVVEPKKIVQEKATLEFQPQETSTPHTTPRKSFSRTIDSSSVGPPPLMMSMDTDADTSAEAGEDTIDEDPLYDSMVNENELESPIAKKTDPINSSAKVKCSCDFYSNSYEMSNFSYSGAECACRPLWLALEEGEFVQGKQSVLGARLCRHHLPLHRAKGHAGEGGDLPGRWSQTDAA